MTLPPLRVGSRAARVRDAVAQAGVDALLVTSLIDIRWLTGFTGSAGQLLVLPDRWVLITDGRYADQATAEMAAAGAEAELAIGRTVAAQIELVRTAVQGLPRLGLDAEHVSWARQRQLAGELAGATTMVPTAEVVLRLRQVKEPAEVARIELAAAIASEALAEVLPLLDGGVTEAVFALELEVAMRRRGAEGPSFPIIVGSGPNSARPHHRAGDRAVREGDLVVVDFGARVDGYCSDMTRTFVVGEPSAFQQELLDLVTAAQAAGVAAVRHGVAAATVDAACRGLIDAGGHGEAFSHGTGHGLGLEIHEPPFLSPSTPEGTSLVAGNVVTVEPGVYRAPLGGVRVEDAVLVTPEGCRTLTLFPKDPRCRPSAPTTSRTG